MELMPEKPLWYVKCEEYQWCGKKYKCGGEINDGKWCGYCKSCEQLWEVENNFKKPISQEDWRKRNWEWCILHDMQLRKAKEEARLGLQMRAEGTVKHRVITISLKDDYDLIIMKKNVEKLQMGDLYGCGQSLSCYEYHSREKPDGGNLHCHILIIDHTKYKPVIQISKIAKLFKIEKNFVDIATAKNDFAIKVGYICGIKKEDKMEYVLKDREWRKRFLLPNVTSVLPKMFEQKYVNELEYARREVV